MKSEKKLTVSDQNIRKKSGANVRGKFCVELKRDSNTKSFFDEYNSLFSKPTTNFGDADSYFKYTLRNYDDFNLFKSLKVHENSVKTTRSSENITVVKRKQRFLLSARRPDSDLFNTDSTNVENSFLNRGDFEEEFKLIAKRDLEVESDETEFEEFFSPNSEIVNEENSPKEAISARDIEIETKDTDTEKIRKSITEEINQEIEEVLNEITKMGEEFNTDTEMTDMEYEGDDEMKEVEKMIAQASNELEQVAEENQQLLDALDEKGGQGKGDSVFKFDPNIDAAVLAELEDAERQAKETAATISALKSRVADLMKKEIMTEVEAKDLERLNKELKTQMLLFEEKTKRIQTLIAQANLFENYIPPKPPLQSKHDEDILPKVIVCGMTENNIPKIIVCSDKKKCATKTMSPVAQNVPPSICSPRNQPGMGMPPMNMNMCGPGFRPPPSMMPNMMPPPQMGVTPQLAQTLNESFCMQEKLAEENQNLEGMRYKLQSDLLNKDQAVECLQRQLNSLQAEMRMICKENSLLNEKLQKTTENRCPSEKSGKNMVCEKGKPCPASVEGRLQQYSETTQCLEKQLFDMEKDVKDMQCELMAVQKERQHLEHHRKMMCTQPPCPPPVCPPHVCPTPSLKTGSPNQQFCELKEQYNRLQDDFKGKLCEVAGLRADNDKLKSNLSKFEEAKKEAEAKVKELEAELKKLKNGSDGSVTSKEQLFQMEQELRVARQRFREAQDELEELRAMIEDQQTQLDEYRNKYIIAQQEVEEQRRQIDMMEMENNRISEQVNLEIQRVKNQFSEKLQELTPLPEILKTTQLKLQEAQQMHLLAERNNEAMARELQLYKDKVAEVTKELDDIRNGATDGEATAATMADQIKQLEETIAQLQEEMEQLRYDLEQARELADLNEKKAQEKLHEIAQLQAQLESVREESARQVARTKDRCETVRRSMQNQISDLEKQLALSRAQAKAAQKDRDEIRQKMQAQINNLVENFEDAQMRIRNLQGHVNFLKTSYNNVFTPHGDAKGIAPDPCNCGANF